MLSYYVVYDFISTEVINIFDNNSQNLLTTYEQCADHLRDTAGFSGQYCSLACFFCSLHPLLHLLPVSLAMLVSLPDLTTSLDPPQKKTPPALLLHFRRPVSARFYSRELRAVEGGLPAAALRCADG